MSAAVAGLSARVGAGEKPLLRTLPPRRLPPNRRVCRRLSKSCDTSMIASLRHNFWYKMLAVFFALLLHFYAAGMINAHPPHILILPLTARNLPPNLILDDKNLPSVTLTLDGPNDEINRLTDTTVNAWVDLSHARAGLTPPLTVHLSPLPANVTVESDPRPVALRLQARQSRKLYISADDIGVAPSSYAFAPPVITPREATITGTMIRYGPLSVLSPKPTRTRRPEP